MSVEARGLKTGHGTVGDSVILSENLTIVYMIKLYQTAEGLHGLHDNTTNKRSSEIRRKNTAKLTEVFLLSWLIANENYNACEKNTNVAKMIAKLICHSTKCDTGNKIMMVTKT